jgi:hypothetical protein
MRMIDFEKWVTVGFFSLLILAALTAHGGALSITSSDTVGLSTRAGDTWSKLESGDIAGTALMVPTAVKLTVSQEKETLEPIIQILPGADLVVAADYSGRTVDVVQVRSDRIEGYYSYGKSNTYPWGFYWCVYDLKGKPFVVYSEFSTRSVWYNYISAENVGKLNDAINMGACPDIGIIQRMVGR